MQQPKGQTMDIEFALDRVAHRLAPGMDSNRAGAIVAYHAAIKRLQGQLDSAPMSPQGKFATQAMVRHYSARIDALSREFA